MATKREVHRLHSDLRRAVKSEFGLDIEVNAYRDARRIEFGGEWERAKTERDIYFAGCRTNAATTPRDLDLRFPLDGDASTARIWWSWQEQWRKTKQDAFALIGVGIVFYWGDCRVGRKLFRAEWDDPSHRGRDAGQPHWHLDLTLTLEEMVAKGPGASEAPYTALGANYDALRGFASDGTDVDVHESGISEASPSREVAAVAYDEISALAPTNDEPAEYDAISAVREPSRVDMAKAHLFMAGWMHGDKRRPKRWQHAISTADIVHWAVATLDYVRGEAPKFRVA